jgi:predicted Ser/Thr protein kinase
MALAVGDKLGPYEILASIGAGGMGEVYKGRDKRLNRIVAIKIAKEQFSERFHKEAKAIAALNHPHICQIYDVGPNYLVMEFVEGAPVKGPLPQEWALKYAAQICDALEAAHRKGITHRDLKPANILATKTAGVKLLDFGLARMDGGGDSTVTMGEVKGTPAYMAPEQWEGQAGDARSDIYAFGCVLHEMLTGKLVAADRTVLDPPAVETIVRSCLEKDPEARWQSAGDFRRALALIAPGQAALSPAKRAKAWPYIAAAAVALLLAALLFALRPTAPPGELARLSILPPAKTLFAGGSTTTVGAPMLALSLDGRSIAFVAAAHGARPTLWVRPLAALTAQSLPDTEGAEYPFWSPDNQWLGFFADGKLKKIPAAGGPALVIAEAPDPRGGSWGKGGDLLFSAGSTAIFRVAESGGMVTPATELDAGRQEGSHRFPQFLPDGVHFLYSARSSLADQTVYVGSLRGGIKKRLIGGNTTASTRRPATCSSWTGIRSWRRGLTWTAWN